MRFGPSTPPTTTRRPSERTPSSGTAPHSGAGCARRLRPWPARSEDSLRPTAQLGGAELSLLTLLDGLAGNVDASAACRRGTSRRRCVQGDFRPRFREPTRALPLHRAPACAGRDRRGGDRRGAPRGRRRLPAGAREHDPRGLIATLGELGGPPVLVHVRDLGYRRAGSVPRFCASSGRAQPRSSRTRASSLPSSRATAIALPFTWFTTRSSFAPLTQTQSTARRPGARLAWTRRRSLSGLLPSSRPGRDRRRPSASSGC